MKMSDTNAYVRVMEEIKRRTAAIAMLLDIKKNLDGLPIVVRAESAALQFRMILELVAFGSLSANKDLFTDQMSRFKGHWHPDEILRHLERLNPNFYPKPFETVTHEGDSILENVPLKEPYLTKEMLPTVYGKCGAILHAKNRVERPVQDYRAIFRQILDWMNLVRNLLNQHEIFLLGDEHFHVVQMTTHEKDSVHIYTFEKTNIPNPRAARRE